MCLDDPEEEKRRKKRRRRKRKRKKLTNVYLTSAGHHGDLSVWRFVSGHDN